MKTWNEFKKKANTKKEYNENIYRFLLNVKRIQEAKTWQFEKFLNRLNLKKCFWDIVIDAGLKQSTN